VYVTIFDQWRVVHIENERQDQHAIARVPSGGAAASHAIEYITMCNTLRLRILDFKSSP
jgi:hypothetical protein